MGQSRIVSKNEGGWESVKVESEHSLDSSIMHVARDNFGSYVMNENLTVFFNESSFSRLVF
jgi:hypothetical protein